MIGATNRPEELDEAARRRFIKRLYIPLPDYQARTSLIHRSIDKDQKNGGTKFNMSNDEIKEIVEKTKGYSAADMHNLMVEVSMCPLRGIDIMSANTENLRAVDIEDFRGALKTVNYSNRR
jgi:SpoVK/Ycf46/Vps4 family AAA+-type ATPase